MAKTQQPKTIEEAVVALQDKAKLTTLEEAASLIGKIIFEQYRDQEFWQQLPKVFPPNKRIETDGRIIGPWLVVVSTGECEWIGEYPVNYLSLWRESKDSFSPIGTKNHGGLLLSEKEQPSESFLKQLENLPQPLMRDFRADSRMLETIVNKAKSAKAGGSGGQRKETEILFNLAERVIQDCGQEVRQAGTLAWLLANQGDIDGIGHLTVSEDDHTLTLTFKNRKPVERAISTFASKFVTKVAKKSQSQNK